MRVLHLITDLDTGGAEMMLYKLIKALPGVGHRVVSMLDPGPVGDKIRSLGVEVSGLGMRRGLPNPAAVLGLARAMRAFAPDVVQAWMYHANLLGLAGAALARVKPVVWNIRCTDMDLSRYGLSARLAVRLGARLSRLPGAIVTNSARAREFHQGLGYKSRRFVVIPNGFDLDVFKPDPEARTGVRAEWGLSPGDFAFGLVARVDPMKDHGTFLEAASLVASRNSSARFVLAGLGTGLDNPEFTDRVRRAGIEDRAVLLGRVDDVPRLLAGLDAAVLSSAFGEGFPNAVGEAMACALPCAVTDVGDAADIVGPAGLVVPPRNPGALASAMEKIIHLPGERLRELGRLARERVAARYSISAVAGQYLELYRDIAPTARA